MVEVYRNGDCNNPDKPKATKVKNRRVYPRFTFVADCLLTEYSSDVRYKTRVMDISMGGCFVNWAAAIAPDTNISIRIAKNQRIFQAEGRVLYSVPSVGSGIVFVSIVPENFQVLESWTRILSH